MVHNDKLIFDFNGFPYPFFLSKQKVPYCQNRKYHTVGSVPKSNQNNFEIGKIVTHNTHIHDHSLSWLDTGTSIKSGRVEL
jgi:NADPH-dependent curcumin reductase CurA